MPFASTNLAASGAKMHRTNTTAEQLAEEWTFGPQPFVSTNLAASDPQPFVSTNLAASDPQPFVLTSFAASGANVHCAHSIAEQLAEEWAFGRQTPLYDTEEYKWYCSGCSDGPYPLWQTHCADCGHKKCSSCTVEVQPAPSN